MGHQLTAYYGIDHGASLAIIMPSFLESQFEERKNMYAQCTEFIFNERQRTTEEKAHAFIEHIHQFIDQLKIPKSVNKWEGATIGENDIDKVTDNVMEQTNDGEPFDYNNCCTREIVHKILEKTII